MMGGGTFILVNAGRAWPESAKQAEIRLATLLKMLQIAHFGTAALASGQKGHPMVVFTAISPDVANTPGIVEALVRARPPQARERRRPRWAL
jgi:hypothetical protein